MLDQGIIRPSESLYASPVVMVPKQDGTRRFCVDFRKLNARIIADCHPIGHIDDSLDSLGNVRATSFPRLTCRVVSGKWSWFMLCVKQEMICFSCLTN